MLGQGAREINEETKMGLPGRDQSVLVFPALPSEMVRMRVLNPAHRSESWAIGTIGVEK